MIFSLIPLGNELLVKCSQQLQPCLAYFSSAGGLHAGCQFGQLDLDMIERKMTIVERTMQAQGVGRVRQRRPHAAGDNTDPVEVGCNLKKE